MKRIWEHPLWWPFFFALPSLVVALFWVIAMILAFRQAGQGTTNDGDKILGAFVVFSVAELAITSLLFAAKRGGEFPVFLRGIGVFVLAVVGNVVGIATITFAGCACAASLSR